MQLKRFLTTNHGYAPNYILILVISLLMSLLIYTYLQFFGSLGAPQLHPMTQFRTERSYNCVFNILGTCNITYYYVGHGNMYDVRNAVYVELQKNPNYSVKLVGDDTIYVAFNDADPNAGSIDELGFGIHFMNPPKSPDPSHAYSLSRFIESENCRFGMTDCVEATIFRRWEPIFNPI